MHTNSVRGMKRVANFAPNAPDCMAKSFTSTIGPTTRNTNWAVGETPGRDAATKASASEHSDSSTASNAMTTIPSHKFSVRKVMKAAGTAAFMSAATAAPTTKKPPACCRSCIAVSRKIAALDW